MPFSSKYSPVFLLTGFSVRRGSSLKFREEYFPVTRYLFLRATYTSFVHTTFCYKNPNEIRSW